MESYISDLLKEADLAVLTKKHIRLKYKEHVGRELLPDEKSRINDMVYAFVKELSALENQNSSPVQSDASPEKKKDSPGNKENKRHEKSSKLIIKGQVVDRNDLYKKSNKDRKNSKDEITPQKQDKHNKTDKQEKSDKHNKNDKQEKSDKHNKNEKHEKHDNQDKQKKRSPDFNKSGEITPKSAYARAAKLKINDVMSAVLGDVESSSEVSSVSSLSDMSLSDIDDKPKKPNMTEALQKLNEAREKKIRMSTEKKKKLKLGSGDKKVRRSLPMKDKGNRVKDLKNKDKAEDSETLSLISEISSGETDRKAENRLGNSPERLASSVDSGEITLIKTPETYVKNKSKLASKDKRFVKIEDKKKKLVKRKIKKKEISSDSDSESDEEVGLERVKSKLTSGSKKSRNSTNKDKSVKNLVDSDSSTGDTPLAKKKVKLTKHESDSELSTGDTPLAKKKVKLTKHDSDSESTGDTPLAKKKNLNWKLGKKAENKSGDTPLIKKKAKSTKIESDSDSTGNTPLAKKKRSNKDKASDNDSDESTGNTPLIKKKVSKTEDMKSLTNLKRVKPKKHETEIRKTYPKRSRNSTDLDAEKTSVTEDKSGHMTSESSSGDTSLAQLKRKMVSKQVESKGTNDVNSDSDSIESPTKMNEVFNDVENDSDSGDEKGKTLTNGKVSKKRKLSTNSNISAENTPISKKKRRKQNVSSKTSENESDKNSSDSELSDLSTDNTPLVKKKTNLRKKAAKAKLNSKTKTNKKAKSDDSDLDSEEDANDADESVVDNSVKSPGKTDPASTGNSDGEVDSPLKVKKTKSRKVRIDSSGSEDEEEDPIEIKKSKTKSKKTINSRKTKNDDEDDESDRDSDAGDSDDSDDIPLASIKSKVYDLSSDSEDDVPLSAMAAQGKKAKEEELETEENINERTYLRLLRQICRECQMFVRNDRELAGCETNQERIEKLEQMLRDVGMKGKPSMRKAEEVKLQKEAKELSADNIISSETGRVMRKVKSIYARRTISPMKPAKPMQNPFTGLKDIVDTDGTESTD